MNQETHLKVETFTRTEDEKHRIHSAKEIEFLLHNIVEANVHVALYYIDEEQFILTTILGVNNKGLWVEQSPNHEINQDIIAAEKLIFVSSHLRVKIQFEASKLEPEQYLDKAAFYLPLPSSLLRLQRREYFRLTTPTLNPLKCVIPITRLPQPKLSEVTIMDISVGGAALTCTEDDTELVPGETYSDCRIDLPGFGTISGTLIVRNWAVLTADDGHIYKRAGCELQDLDNPSITMLNRYIMHMQRSPA